MRRGTKGHVAEPHKPTRAPAWHGGDTCAIFICIYILYMVIVRINIRKSDMVICIYMFTLILSLPGTW